MPTYRDTMSPSLVEIAYDSEQVFERCCAAHAKPGAARSAVSQVEGDE